MRNKIEHSVSILTFFYGIVPIVAGLDKFFNVLVDWEVYVSPLLGGIDPSTFLAVVGVVEIIAGIIVFVKTRIGAYIVSVWLALIGLNLLSAGYYDIAVRDFVMAAGAYVLAVLAGDESESSLSENGTEPRPESVNM